MSYEDIFNQVFSELDTRHNIKAAKKPFTGMKEKPEYADQLGNFYKNLQAIQPEPIQTMQRHPDPVQSSYMDSILNQITGLSPRQEAAPESDPNLIQTEAAPIAPPPQPDIARQQQADIRQYIPSKPIMPTIPDEIVPEAKPLEGREIPKSRFYWKKPDEQLNAVDKLRDVLENPDQMAPFIGDAKNIGEVVELHVAAKRLEDNIADADDIRLLKDYVNNLKRDKTFGYKVADIVSNLPKFMGELGLTSGIFKAVKSKSLDALSSKVGQDLLKKRAVELALKGTATTLGATAQALPAGATRIPVETVRKMIPGIQETPTGLVIQPGDDKSVVNAFQEAATEQWIEVLSERSGGMLTQIMDPAKRKIAAAAIKSGVFNSFIKKNAGQGITHATSKFNQIIDDIGWNGIIEEIFEERVGDVMRKTLGLQENLLPTAEQLGVELVAFAIPGVSIAAANKLLQGVEPSEAYDILPEETKAEVEAEAAIPKQAATEPEPVIDPLDIEPSPIKGPIPSAEQGEAAAAQAEDVPEKIEPKLGESIGKKVKHQGKRGTITEDTEGNILFETKNEIIELGRKSTDMDRGLSEFDIEEISTRKYQPLDENTFEIDGKKYSYVRTNQLKDNQASITALNEAGSEVTIRDPEIVLEIEIERAKYPNEYQIRKPEEQADLQVEKNQIINQDIIDQGVEPAIVDKIDIILDGVLSEDVEAMLDAESKFDRNYIEASINDLVDAASLIDQMENDYAKKVSQSLLNLAEEVEYARQKELSEPERQDQIESEQERTPDVEQAEGIVEQEVTKAIAQGKPELSIEPPPDAEYDIPDKDTAEMLYNALKDKKKGNRGLYGGTRSDFPEWNKGRKNNDTLPKLKRIIEGRKLTKPGTVYISDLMKDYKQSYEYYVSEQEKAREEQLIGNLKRLDDDLIDAIIKDEAIFNSYVDAFREETEDYTNEEIREAFISIKGSRELLPEEKQEDEKQAEEIEQPGQKALAKPAHEMTPDEYKEAVLSGADVEIKELGFSKKISPLADKLRTADLDDAQRKSIESDLFPRIEQSHYLIVTEKIKSDQEPDKAKPEPTQKKQVSIKPTPYKQKKVQEKPQTKLKATANAKRLRERADALQSRIDERLADRQTNTARRARMAGNIFEEGQRLQRRQQTLRNIADQIEKNPDSPLAKISSAAELDTLDTAYRSASDSYIKNELNKLPENRNKSWPEMRQMDFPESKLEQYALMPLAGSPASFSDHWFMREADKTKGFKRHANKVRSWIQYKDNLRGIPDDVRDSLELIVKNFGKDSWIGESIRDEKRLKKMGVENNNQLVDLLRSYRDILKTGPKAKVKTPEEIEFTNKFEGVTRQSHPGFFPTPKALIEKMVDEADIEPGMSILEPSAGRGDIANYLRDKGHEPKVAEWNATLRNLLIDQKYDVVADDFFELTEKYDRIIMNPPFEKLADTEHVKHAYSLLKPGGKLVSIMSESPFFNSQKKASEFREWLDEVEGWSEKNDPGAFLQGPRKTGVNTRTVYIEKPKTDSQVKADAKKNAQTFAMRSDNAVPFNQLSLDKSESGKIEFKNRQEMVRYLSEKLGVPIRRGKFMQRALGIFKIQPRIIRIKKGLLNTEMHEIGHYLRESIPAFKAANLRPFKSEFEPIATKGDVYEEGNAEFVRMYALTPQIAKELAPRYYDYFESMMERYAPESLDVIHNVQRDIKRWAALPATQKIISEINFDETKRPKPTLRQVYSMVVEDVFPIKKYVDLARQSGVNITEETDAYTRARLLKGWSGKVTHFLHKGTLDEKNRVNGESLESILNKWQSKESLDEFRGYLIARRTLELAERGIKTQVDKPTAKRSIEEMEKKYPDIKQDALRLYKFQDNVLRYARNSGLLSDDLVKKIRKMNRNYIPFYRVYEEAIRQKEIAGKSMGDVSQVIKKIKGSEREFLDPIESVVKNTYALINSVERNKVAQSMAALSRTHHNLGQMFERIPPKMIKKASVSVEDLLGKRQIAEMMETGVINEESIEMLAGILSEKHDIFGIGKYNNERVIQVYEDGKLNYYEVEADLYNAMKEMDHEQTNLVIRLMSYPAKWLRAGATLNPDFPIRNIFRDQIMAAIQANYGFLPVIDTARGLFSVIKKNDLYWDWLKSGASNSSLVSLDRSSLQENMKRMNLEMKRDKKFKDSIIDVAKSPLRAMQIVSELMENATRIGVYNKARMKGASSAAAAYESREATQDFSRIGSKTKSINMIIAFFNANIGGNDKLARQFATKPLQSTFRSIAYITIPSLLLWYAQKDDENYKEVPRWQKDLFWIIVTYKPNGDPFIWRIPKPFALGVAFGSLPERIAEFINSKDAAAFDNYMGSMIGTLTPGFLPTVALPFIENLTNFNFFTGRQMMPQHMQKMENFMQQYPYTSETLKALGEKLNLSPIQMENFIKAYGAGLGKLGLQALDKMLLATGVLKSVDRPSPTAADIPVLRGFVVRNPIGSASQSVDKFYQNYEKITKVHSTYKELSKQNPLKAKKYKRKHPEMNVQFGLNRSGDPITAYTYFNRVNRDLAKIRRQQREIHYSSTMDAKSKRKAMDDLNAEMTLIANAANKTYKSIIKK